MTYPLPSPPICGGCGHPQLVHEYGVRRGRKARTRCTHGDAEHGMCPCAEFAPPTLEGGEVA